jgi:hypothetical protein
LPEPAIGGHAFGLVDPFGWLGLELEGALFPFSPQSTANGQVDWHMGYAGIAVCPALFASERVVLRACLGGQVGFVRVDGPAVTEPVERIVGQLVARARVLVRVVGPLAVYARPTFAYVLRQEPYEVALTTGSSSVVYTPEPVAFGLDLGLAVLF